MPPKITVLLVDDHALVRRGFRRMLEDDPTISVVAEASDGPEAVRLALELRPQVIVMDCALPEFNGIEATRRIRKEFPAVEILMLSMHSEETLVRQALDAGARGYVLKNAMDLDLVSAVKTVALGKAVLDPQVSKARISQGRTRLRSHRAGTGNFAVHRGRKIQQRNRRRSEAQRQHRGGASREYHGRTGHSQNRGTGGLRHS